MTAAAPTPPSPGNWFTRGGWWFFVHVCSLGILAAVPFAHAAVRSRRIGHAVAAVAVLAATLLAFLLDRDRRARRGGQERRVRVGRRRRP